jgi:uncharacterized repeat protein (TIGR01451 family)
VTKTGDRSSAELGDSILYTVTVTRTDTGTGVLAGAAIVDTLPAGFRYIDGTAFLTVKDATTTKAPVKLTDHAGKPSPQLTFALTNIPASGTLTLTYRVRLGVGAVQGSGINRAQAKTLLSADCTKEPDFCSNEAQYKVKVTSGVFSHQACVIGKVYVDCNNNHVQDNNELGIPGVRMYLQDGTSITTDVGGQYSYCGLEPRTHVLVLDQTTLPRASVMTTSSSRNVGDALSLFLDLKNGELHRADFIEGSCSAPVLDQVKTRRNQGGINDVIPSSRPNNGPNGKVIEFDSKPATSK